MIHEDITISGSFQASGSFILPRIPSNSLATATTGSMFYDTVNDVVKIYNGTGSTEDGYITVGAQTAPATSGGGGSGASDDIEYLVIAGGSSGGVGSDRSGGGGGAGGYLSSSLSDIESGSQITVTVGAGGATKTSEGQGNDGSDSTLVSAAGTSFTTVTALGGGGGGYPGDGRDGGSGGGGAHGGTSGGSGTVGQGNDGGDGSGESPYAGAGGGGAGAAGSNSSPGSAGTGGNGLASSITGTSTTRAGGGGGGGSVDAAGGTGGGGHGATGTANPGITNTGGGGGGAQINGGAGGSGVAIFSYPTGSITAVGGHKTSRSDGQFVHTFKSSGTLTVGGPTFHTTAPGDYFNVVTYTGNGSTQAITGVGFQPDLIWIKGRDFSDNHNIGDSTRGAQKYVFPNLTSKEFSSSNYFTSFDSDGFTLGSDGSGNSNNSTFVAWCWKANGGTTSAGSGTNVSSVLNQVNTNAGFSITTFTGAASAAGNFSHGLGEVPEMYLVKSLSFDDSWFVWHKDLDNTTGYALRLNTTAAQQNLTGFWNDTAPTSTLISLGNGILVNNATYVAYAFKSVEGYSKFGTYEGNQTLNTDNVVNFGFKAAFVMIKNADESGSQWMIIDSARTNGYAFYANANGGESNYSTDVLISSQGLRFGSNNINVNKASRTYIYWAISE